MPQGFYGRVSRDGEGKLVSVTWPLVVITALMLSFGRRERERDVVVARLRPRREHVVQV